MPQTRKNLGSDERAMPVAGRIFIGFVIMLSIATVAAAKLELLFAASRNPLWAMPIELPDSNYFYQISSDLYISAPPSPQALVSYQKLGLKSFISLGRPRDDQGLLQGPALNYTNIPLERETVTDHDITRALAQISRVEKPALVYDSEGAVLTGAVLAAYRVIYQNWDKEEAVNELVNGGYGFDRKKKNVLQQLRNMNVENIKKDLSLSETGFQ